MKQGQVKQVFIYIMTILIVGFIIIIAMRSFSRLDETRCSAERLVFQQDLSTVLENNLAYGREERVELSKPCDFEVLCLVDARAIPPNQDVSGSFPISQLGNLRNDALKFTLADENQRNIINDSVKSGVEQNVFLIKRNFVDILGFEKYLHLGTSSDLGPGICPTNIDCPIQTLSGNEQVPAYAYCIREQSGKFIFRLLGQGRSVLARPA